jgi:raffinose/stachyose/melibiose transport system permease protein
MVTAISWTLFFNSVDGPAAAFLALFGKFSNFFGDQKLAFVLCIAAQIWMYMGYSMVIFLAGLQTIPKDLYEAARIDGCTSGKEFWYITFPMLWPSITVNGLMSIIGSLSSFQIILLTTGGNFNTTTLAMTAYANAFGLGKIATITGLRQGYAAAINMILFTIILVFVLLFRYLMKKKAMDE